MPWEFRVSAKRASLIRYRQEFKKWTCEGGERPRRPFEGPEVIRIEGEVTRLYGAEKGEAQ